MNTATAIIITHNVYAGSREPIGFTDEQAARDFAADYEARKGAPALIAEVVR